MASEEDHGADSLDSQTLRAIDELEAKELLEESKFEEELKETTNDQVFDSTELVIFFGPPRSGKTAYYYREYATTHTRISVDEAFRKNKDVSFHRVLHQVIGLLKSGKSVVIDDENRHPRTRRSYLRAIQEQQDKQVLGLIKLIAVIFEPLGGLQQCLWANEWELAANSIENELPSTTGLTLSKVFDGKSSKIYEDWFHADVDVPNKEEGFNVVKTCHSRIQCKPRPRIPTPYSRKPLFIDATSILSIVRPETQKIPAKNVENEEEEEADNEEPVVSLEQYKVQLSSQDYCLEKTLIQYLQYEHNLPVDGIEENNPAIILLIDETAFYPAMLECDEYTDNQEEIIKKWRLQMQMILENLSTVIQQPVYYVTAEYAQLETNSFFMMPNWGMFAYAQYLYGLDMETAMLVTNDTSSTSVGYTLGLTSVIKPDDFFRETGWDIPSKLRKYALNFSINYPSFLLSIEYNELNDEIEDSSSNQEDQLPKEYHSGPLPGRMHGRCTPAISMEEDFFFDETDTGMNDTDKPSTTSTEFPVPENIEAAQSLQPDKLPKLSDAYLQYLFTPQNYDRGLQYHHADTVFNRRLAGCVLTGMCKGSSCPPYTVEAALNRKGVRYTSCSCPIGSDGKCKHCVALLLSWIHHCDKFKIQKQSLSIIPPSPVPPTPKQPISPISSPVPNTTNNNTSPVNETPVSPTSTVSPVSNSNSDSTPRKRKLPTWMQEPEPKRTKRTSTDSSKSRRKINFAEDETKEEPTDSESVDEQPQPKPAASTTPKRAKSPPRAPPKVKYVTTPTKPRQKPSTSNSGMVQTTLNFDSTKESSKTNQKKRPRSEDTDLEEPATKKKKSNNSITASTENSVTPVITGLRSVADVLADLDKELAEDIDLSELDDLVEPACSQIVSSPPLSSPKRVSLRDKLQSL